MPFLLLGWFGYSPPASPDEYGTGSGSDRVPIRFNELGVAGRPGRYRFRFCILRPTLALYAWLALLVYHKQTTTSQEFLVSAVAPDAGVNLELLELHPVF